jgi:hypothetical protein
MREQEQVRQDDHAQPVPCEHCKAGRMHSHEWAEKVAPISGAMPKITEPSTQAPEGRTEGN